MMSDYTITAEEYRKLADKDKPTKYRNKPTVVDGIRFDSQAEATRYGELKWLEREGKVEDVKVHSRWVLTVNGEKVCTYEADFDYFDRVNWRYTVEDVKGVRTQAYKIKRRLMKAIHGIDIVEVEA